MLNFWDYFGFRATWSPYLILVLLAVFVLYVLFTGPLKHKIGGTEPISVKKITLFAFGLILLYVALGSPLDLLAHISFSAHMLSMAIGYIAAPPLLLLGIPNWMYRQMGKLPHISKLNFLKRPIFTTILFNGLFSLYHLPLVHDYVMTHYTVHTVYFIVLLITSLLMWWPIINPLPDTSRLSDLKKIAYIFINGVLLTPACVMIIFANHAMFETYTNPELWTIAMGYCLPAGSAALLANIPGPEVFLSYDPRADQQLGGVVMKLCQELIYGATLLYIFMNWYRKENSEDHMEENWTEQNLNRA